MGDPGGEDFWPIERRPFELEELSGGLKEGVSSPRDETVPVRAASKGTPETCRLHEPYSRKAWAGHPETQF